MGLATALIETINTRDHRLMKRVHRWHAPRWIRLWMICATRGGDGWIWYILAAAVLTAGGQYRYQTTAAAVLAVGLGIACFLSLKRLTGRKRPCHVEPHCWATLLPPDQFSFPSGHTITAFAVAVPVSLFYPNLSVGLFFCAASIGASRILLGMHYLSDVIAGAIIGAVLGLCTQTLFA